MSFEYGYRSGVALLDMSEDESEEDLNEIDIAVIRVVRRESAFESFGDWLASEHRRGRDVQMLRIRFDELEIYEDLCDMLDELYEQGDTRAFKNVHLLTGMNLGLKLLPMPTTLKAQHLNIRILGRRGGVDWDNTGENLCNELTTIEIKADVEHFLPVQTTFRKLKRVSVILNQDQRDNFQQFLLKHPTIEHLNVSSGKSMFEDAPFFDFKGLDRLRSLKCSDFQFDFVKAKLPSLKQLTVGAMTEPLCNWNDMPVTLEKLQLYNFGVEHGPAGSSLPHEDYIGADHTLLNPDELHKLDRLKVLEISSVDSSALGLAFNEGIWDDAMPQLEVLNLEHEEVTRDSLDRFAAKHPRLQSASYGIKCKRSKYGNMWLPKGPVEALRYR